jgi:error-prone DNA polymerase
MAKKLIPPRYAELQVTTNFSFLRGASYGEELVAQAHALGLAAIAVTDRNTLSGVVRAHLAAKELGLKLIVGARLDLQDAPSLLCLPRDRQAYGRLSRLLSMGQRRAKKGECILYLEDVAQHAEGQICIALAPDDWDWSASKPAAPTAAILHLRPKSHRSLPPCGGGIGWGVCTAPNVRAPPPPRPCPVSMRSMAPP